jgi:hypothetical protein
MEQRSVEGTWEKILCYSPELIGRRVRLTVLPNETSEAQNKTTLDKLLEGRVGRVQFQPANLSVNVKESFADLLVNKYNLPELDQ